MTVHSRRVVEEAIDQAAREYSAIEPAPRLRHRVLDQLAVSPGVRWTRLLVPLASVAAIVLLASTWFARPRAVPSIGRPVPMTQTLDGTPINVARLQPIEVPRAVLPGVPTPPTEAGLESETARAWRERAIPALPRPEALSVDRIQPEAVHVTLLVVEPLVTTRLTVEPLTPGREGER